MIDPRSPDHTNAPGGARRPAYGYSPAGDAPPVVSIVTPFHNPGAVFEETAASVRGQSLQAWEWLIVNDGSTDPASIQLLDRYREADPRIRVIDLPENRGPGAARNAGVALARSEYLLLLDADDLLEPTAAEKWWWFLESYPELAFTKGYSVGFGAMEYLAATGFHDEQSFLDGNRVDVTSLVRATTYRHAGGFPEGNRAGLEDWEFWLRCADAGTWGGTVPEYLSWYRRRDDHEVRWPNWEGPTGSAAMQARMRTEFPWLFADPARFPSVRPSVTRPDAHVLHASAGENRLTKARPRLLMVVPWLAMGGADRFNLDLTDQLTSRGWEVSIATTLQGDDSWLPAFTRLTPDVFVLPNFLRLSDYPRFLCYLLASRQHDAVLVSNSELGYQLLPYLRARCPQVACVDFCHMEESGWRNGGYPRYSVEYQSDLDLSITASDYLKNWMIREGAPAERIEVSHCGVAVPTVEHIDRLRRAWRQSLNVGETAVILYAGRMVAQKQPQVFADTLDRLAGDDTDWIAVVAGDGPELPGLRARLGTERLARRTRVLGAVPPETMDGLLAAADVLFLPSKWEGIALVMHEAMVRGVPVVGADVGGQRELVTDDVGILVTPSETTGTPRATETQRHRDNVVPGLSGTIGHREVVVSGFSRTSGHDADVAAYAAALRRLLGNRDLRVGLGARGRERVMEHFRVDQMGERMATLLREAIDRHEQTPRPSLNTDAALAVAEGVVEAFRLQYVAYWDWIQASRAPSVPPGLGLRAFRALTVLEPAYRWGLRRGWTWLPDFRRRVRRHLLAALRLDR